MYEIWLTLNILWELAAGAWPAVAASLLLWLVVVSLACLRRVSWRRSFLPALLLSAAAAAVAFLAIPGWTKSSLSELGYWVDWLNLLALAAAAGGITAAFAWPLIGMLKGRRP
jgi:hypothetical protein